MVAVTLPREWRKVDEINGAVQVVLRQLTEITTYFVTKGEKRFLLLRDYISVTGMKMSVSSRAKQKHEPNVRLNNEVKQNGNSV